MKEENTLSGQKKLRNRRIWKKCIIALFLLVLVLIGGLLVLRYVTYEHINVVEVYDNKSVANGNYKEYADGVIEYSKDGIAYLKEDGSEIWNQPCQMRNPFAEICQGAVSVADKGGTNILVFQEEGIKGEIKTTRPIEKVSVSAQGIVAAMLTDDEIPQIMCYDAKGNVLVELNATFSSTGYPVDIALSQDGNVLIVSYLKIKGVSAESQVVYYHFGEAGEHAEEHKVAELEFAGAVVPITTFLDEEISLLVSDSSFVLMKGLEKPETINEITFDKIKIYEKNNKYYFTAKAINKTKKDIKINKINIKLDNYKTYSYIGNNLKSKEYKMIFIETNNKINNIKKIQFSFK